MPAYLLDCAAAEAWVEWQTHLGEEEKNVVEW
jgi:hypothetical protein